MRPQPVINFLTLISFSEGATYNTIVTGVHGPETFSDFSQHPFDNQLRKPQLVQVGPPPLYSTASGRYQILLRYWHAYRDMLKLPDFSPDSQDAVAAQILAERSAILPLMNGDIVTAIERCSNIWASFPGNNYGQGGHSMARLLNAWGAIEAGHDPNAIARVGGQV